MQGGIITWASIVSQRQALVTSAQRLESTYLPDLETAFQRQNLTRGSISTMAIRLDEILVF